MKTRLFLFLLLIASMLQAQTIINPSFKVRAGSILTITQIERTPESTKLQIHAVFRPHWWITVDKDNYLEDTATGEKYLISGSKGIELGEKTYMPASGEMDFTLLFSPLPQETKEIHFIAPDSYEYNTYNISLEKNQLPDPLKAIKGNWMTVDEGNEWTYGFYDSFAITGNQFYTYKNIQKGKKKLTLTLKDEQGNLQDLILSPQKNGDCFIQKKGADKLLFSKKTNDIRKEKPEPDFTQFFRPDSVHLQGYIQGYDPRLGFETAIIYLSDEFMWEDYPTVIAIQPDGKFECTFKIDHPIESYIALQHNTIPFYIEPGQTLTIYIDWEEILAYSRSRNYYTPINNIQYMGPGAPVCRTTKTSGNLLYYPYEKLSKAQKELSPAQFKEQLQPTFQLWEQIVDSLITTNSYSEKAIHLLKNKLNIKKGEVLLNFLMSRDYYARQEPENKILQIKEENSYYDFLKQMPLDDETLLADKSFSSFINRFEYMDILKESYSTKQPDSIFITYPKKPLLSFLKKKGVKLTEELERICKKEEKLAGTTSMVKLSELIAEKKIANELYKKEKKLVEEYDALYTIQPSPEQEKQNQRKRILFTLERMQRKDSIIHSICGKPSPFLWQIAEVRSIKNELKQMKKREIAHNFLTDFEKKLKHPFLITKTEEIFRKTHPDKTIETYELPAGKATDIFRNIIKDHFGKTLFVDFWATSCAPCRAGIEATANLRKEYKDHPEFQFIYITSEKESPLTTYNQYVDKNLTGEASYRVSETEFNYLRQLFRFNGIPHYELIEKDGSVSQEGVESYNLDSYLKIRFKKTE